MKSENLGIGEIKKGAQQPVVDVSRMEYTINNSSDVGDDSIKEDIVDPHSMKGSVDAAIKNKQKRNKQSS